MIIGTYKMQSYVMAIDFMYKQLIIPLDQIIYI